MFSEFPFLLPLWEKVAIGGLQPPFFSRTPMPCIGCAQSVPGEGSLSADEGFHPRRETPHPDRKSDPTSPTRGEVDRRCGANST